MSFQQALSGLNAASKNLEVIGNNVSNSNTVGFKNSSAQFADIFANSIGGTAQAGIGTNVAAVAQSFTQGNLTVTNNPLDMAINAQGFFRMSSAGAINYTRNGQFQLDKSGFIVNTSGANLTGYNAINGVVATGTLANLQIPNTNLAPKATTTITASSNLSSAQLPPTVTPFNPANPLTFNNSAPTTVYDSLGQTHSVMTYFIKTAVPNQWNVLTYLDGASADAAQTAGNVSTLVTAAATANGATAAQAALIVTAAQTAAATAGATQATISAAINTAATTAGLTATQATTIATAAIASGVSPTATSPASITTAVTNAVNAAIVAPAATAAQLAAINTAATTAAAAPGATQASFMAAINAAAIAPAPAGAGFTAAQAASIATQVTNAGINIVGTGTATVLNFTNTGAYASATNLAKAPLLTNGSVTPFNFALNFSAMTQYGTSSSPGLIQDGYTSGQLASFGVGTDGTITGRYTNGQSQALGQVALANFTNVQGLAPLGNNQFAETSKSGPPFVGIAGTSNLGTIQAASVENSNVDLTAELVNMITAQRAYQANAQTVKTQDQILQTIVSLR